MRALVNSPFPGERDLSNALRMTAHSGASAEKAVSAKLADVGHADAVRPVGVFVVGMHRSGTSALSRTLNLLGASLPQDVLGPSDNNPLGHWEPRLAYELNNEILESLGSSWSALPPLPHDWFASQAAESFAERAATFLRTEVSATPMFVLKEPRLCLLAPIWLRAMQIAGMDVRVIIPIRHPEEVARSLNARSGMPLGQGVLVWLRNILEGEHATRGRPRAFVTYERLLDDWRGVMGDVRERLHLSWPRDEASASDEIDGFLSPDHRHHTATDASENVWLVDALGALTALVANPNDAKAMRRLDGIRASFDQASLAFQPVIEGAVAQNRARAEITRQELKRLRRVAELEAARLAEELEAARSKAATPGLHEALADRSAEVQKLSGLLSERDEAVQSWKDAAVRVAGEVGEKAAAALKSQQAETAAVQARLSEALDALGRMRAQLDKLQRETVEVAQRQIAASAAQLDEARERVGVLEAQAVGASAALVAAKFKRNLQIKMLERNVADLQAAVALAERTAAAHQAEAQAAQQDRERMLVSSYWRMTGPVRWLTRSMRPSRKSSSVPQAE